MTSNQAAGNVAYETEAQNAYRWTEKAFDLLLEEKLNASVETKAGVHSARVDGECPHCGHNVNFRQVLDVVVGESMATLGERTVTAEPEYVTLTVSCRCTEPHAGRPDKIDHGCGINFRVDVRADG